jgi:hypothetical protein
VSFALPDALFFTGIDWAAETHAVCVMEAGGKIAAQFTIEHSADGITALLRRLARYGDPGALPAAIERPDGRLVDLLLEAGHPVVPVKPNAIKTWREGEVLSGAKSDAGDAAVIAEYLRLRAHKLRVAAPYSDQTCALRTVVRSRGDLVKMRVAATNQLSAVLDAHWPGARAIFADVESPVSLEFLTCYPTPAAAAHLGEQRMAAFCLKHGYSGRRRPAGLLARLRSAPAGATGEKLTEALRDAVFPVRWTARFSALPHATSRSVCISGRGFRASRNRRCPGKCSDVVEGAVRLAGKPVLTRLALHERPPVCDLARHGPAELDLSVHPGVLALLPPDIAHFVDPTVDEEHPGALGDERQPGVNRVLRPYRTTPRPASSPWILRYPIRGSRGPADGSGS